MLIISAIFARRVSTVFELSFGTCFQIVGSFNFFDRAIINWLNQILSVVNMHALLHVSSQSRVYIYFFLSKFQIVVESDSTLPSLKTCYEAMTFVEYFKVALRVEIKPW